MFKFSVTYKENVVIISLIVVVLCALVYGVSVIAVCIFGG